MSKDYASILILISKNINLEKILVHATCTSPIMHLICAPQPQILHNLCFLFLLGITAVPREIESNAYAKYWEGGQLRCTVGDVQVAYGPIKLLNEPSSGTLESVDSEISSPILNFL